MQLHGDEGIEACADCGVPALRVVHVPALGGGEAAAVAGEGEAASAKTRADRVLEQLPPGYAAGVVLDTTVEGVQGEGSCVDVLWGVGGRGVLGICGWVILIGRMRGVPRM